MGGFHLPDLISIVFFHLPFGRLAGFPPLDHIQTRLVSRIAKHVEIMSFSSSEINRLGRFSRFRMQVCQVDSGRTADMC